MNSESMLPAYFLDLPISVKVSPSRLKSYVASRTTQPAPLILRSASRRHCQWAGHRSDMRRPRRNPKAVTYKAKPLPQRDVMIAGFGLGYEVREAGGAIHSGF